MVELPDGEWAALAGWSPGAFKVGARDRWAGWGPEAPHSVTILCVLHEGSLIIPAMNGSAKQWTANVVRDPRVRIKIGEEVYPAGLGMLPQEGAALP